MSRSVRPHQRRPPPQHVWSCTDHSRHIASVSRWSHLALESNRSLGFFIHSNLLPFCKLFKQLENEDPTRGGAATKWILRANSGRGHTHIIWESEAFHLVQEPFVHWAAGSNRFEFFKEIFNLIIKIKLIKVETIKKLLSSDRVRTLGGPIP